MGLGVLGDAKLEERKGQDRNSCGLLPSGACRFSLELSGIGRARDCFKLSVNKFPFGLSGSRSGRSLWSQRSPPRKWLPEAGDLALGGVFTAKASAWTSEMGASNSNQVDQEVTQTASPTL